MANNDDVEIAAGISSCLGDDEGDCMGILSGPSFRGKFLSKLFEAEEDGEGDRDGLFALVKVCLLLPRVVCFLWAYRFLLRGIVGIILLVFLKNENSLSTKPTKNENLTIASEFLFGDINFE